ncbi:MAG: hypothetical protein H7263_13330 [Candidatus Sericytochromatia bacterium]|nr:hypothetical protein [Candidatus Sericytochromatia bacterium]
MKIFYITLSATLGILGLGISGWIWGNNFMSGGYDAFSAFWPLWISALLCCALVVEFKICHGFKFREVFLNIFLPYVIGVVSVLAMNIFFIAFPL